MPLLHFYRIPHSFFSVQAFAIHINNRLEQKRKSAEDLEIETNSDSVTVQIKMDFYRTKKLSISLLDDDHYYFHIGIKQTKKTTVGRLLETMGLRPISLQQVKPEFYKQISPQAKQQLIPAEKVKDINRKFGFLEILVGILITTMAFFLNHGDYYAREMNWVYLVGGGFVAAGILSLATTWMRTMDSLWWKTLGNILFFLILIFTVDILLYRMIFLICLTAFVIVYFRSLKLAK